jgi:hypothetical protein
MNIDIAPYKSFADFRICQTDWDFAKEYQVVADRITEEKLLDDMEKVGISESDLSFLINNLKDLQYDYLISRLGLKGNLEFYRFMFRIAESLNRSGI